MHDFIKLPSLFTFFLLLSALLLIEASAASPLEPKVCHYRTFRLRADTKSADASVSKLGYLDARMGFYPKHGTDFVGYITPYDNGLRTTPQQKTWGKLHVAQSPAAIMYLRPTHGTPMYFVLLGDPQGDPTPPLTRWDSWGAIEGKDKKRVWLGMGEDTGSWMACKTGGSDGYLQLYNGPQVGPPQCTVNFSLEVVWGKWVATKCEK